MKVILLLLSTFAAIAAAFETAEFQMLMLRALFADRLEELKKAIDIETSASQNVLEVGSVFECFEEEAVCTVLKKLGEGAMGIVFKVQVNFKDTGDIDESDRVMLSREDFLKTAIHSSSDVIVAVKVSKKGKPQDIKDSLQEAYGNLFLKFS
jgi:hypothetical protein